MMWKEFYKDGKAYTFEMNSMYSGIKDREELLISEGYTPIFDRRTLHYINGRSGTAILENEGYPTDEMIALQNEIKSYSNFKSIKHIQCCNLHPEHLKELKVLIDEKNVKNILIDSLFKDIKQFRFIVKHLFSNCTEINFFINSHGTLIKTLQEELDENMDKYEIRNPYYKHGANNKPYFNDLVFTLMKNNIYEVDGDLMKKIKCLAGYDKCEVSYNGVFKFIKGQYKTNDTDIEPIEQKSKWE